MGRKAWREELNEDQVTGGSCLGAGWLRCACLHVVLGGRWGEKEEIDMRVRRVERIQMGPGFHVKSKGKKHSVLILGKKHILEKRL